MSWNSSSRRVTNFSDLIQRVTASCLLHPLANQSQPATCHNYSSDEAQEQAAAEESCESETNTNSESSPEDEDSELAVLTGQVFDAVADMKRAYVSLQAAHSPWDPDKMLAADVAVVAEFKRVGVLRERFRRRGRNTGGCGENVREVVKPYEAALEELKRELKAKQSEVDNLRAKQVAMKERRERSEKQSKRKLTLNCSIITHVAGSPAPELFETTMTSVIKASKSFSTVLLSLMRSANWDMAATAKSIHASTADPTATLAIGPHHAKYAIESYINHKIFQGFNHETFYMDGSLSSLLDPDQFRHSCFTQYGDMQGMDPAELLGILPMSPFGNFCSKKYLEIIHEKMEDSLFGGDLEQRRHVVSGTHPRTHFYGQFLALAKAVWLLHLLAFSLDPPPSRFETTRGLEFNPQFMENVGSGNVGHQLVGFPLTPGFKLGNGSVIKVRVCLVPLV